jgi:hypothetical protein
MSFATSTNGSSSGTTKVQITQSGRVLIGTTTESTFLLDVNGTARVQSTLNVSGNTKIGNTVYSDANSALIVGIDGTSSARGAVANNSNYQDFIFVNTNISSGNINSWSFGQRRDTYFGNTAGSFQIVGAYINNSGNGSMVGGGFRVPLIANPNGDLLLVAASNSVNGNVGIGTTSPSAKLDVSAANNEIRSTGTSSTYTQYNAFITSGVNMRIGAYATNNGYLGTTTNHPFTIETNNTQRARFFANGNLLIGSGTTDGGYLLDVSGTARVTTSAYFATASGSVGIGTTTPASLFNAVSGTSDFRFSTGTSANTPTISVINTGASGKAAALLAGTNGSAFAFDQAGFFAITTEAKSSFTSNTNGSGTARLTIFGNGNVGIGVGTTDAGYRLDVSGTTRISGTELRLDNGTTGTLNIYSNTPTINFFSGGGYTFGRSGTTMNLNSAGSINMQIGGNDAYAISSANGHIWRSAISGGAALGRLTTGGNMIIGSTTDAGFRLDVNGTARVQSNISFGNLASNSFIYAEANGYLTQSMNFQIGGSSNLIGLFRGWGTSGNGTLGGINTASMVNIFSQSGPLMLYANSQNIYFATTTSSLFTLSHSNQNIGIGTTSPNASALLDVSSTTKGFLPPRMTTTQKNAISSPAAGLVVYDTTLSKLCVYTTAWQTITSI